MKPLSLFIILIVTVLVMFTGVRVHAQETGWARNVRGDVLMTPTMTLQEARDAATSEARAEAIRIVAGVRIQSETARWQSEHMGEAESKYFDLFSMAHRSTTFGKILSSKILHEGIENVQVPGLPIQQMYSVTIDAEVVKDITNPDPSFQLELTLNRDVFQDIGDPLKNDEMIIRIRPTIDCYLTILGLSRDTVSVLFPNDLASNPCVYGSTLFEFPSQDFRQRGVHLRVKLPEGVQKMNEMVIVIGTKEPIEFISMVKTKGRKIIPTYLAAFDDLTRWLVQIPPDERTESSISYEIHRR